MSSNNIKMESGLQLLARLTKNQDLSKFYPELFEQGLKHTETVEICSEPNCGKSLLVIDIICKALLPGEGGGLDTGILFFNTDGNFLLNTLINVLKQKFKHFIQSANEHELDYLVSEVLNNFYMLDVFEPEQFYITIENLDNILVDYANISLIIIDTLTAFYWSEQLIKITKMETYKKSIIERIKKITKAHKIPLIYTRPQYFSSTTNELEDQIDCISDYIEHKIMISKDKTNDGSVLYKISKQSYGIVNSNTEKIFQVEDNCINWI